MVARNQYTVYVEAKKVGKIVGVNKCTVSFIVPAESESKIADTI